MIRQIRSYSVIALFLASNLFANVQESDEWNQESDEWNQEAGYTDEYNAALDQEEADHYLHEGELNFMATREKPLQAFAAVSSRNFTETSELRCTNRIILKFSRPINIATMLGRVALSSPSSAKVPFFVEHYDRAFKEFVLESPAKVNCNTSRDVKRIWISDGIHSLDGHKLSKQVSLGLGYATGTIETKNEFGASLMVPSDLAWVRKTMTYQGGMLPSRVSGADLNRAFNSVREWTLREKLLPMYKTKGLVLLPENELNLKAFNEHSRKRHYAATETLFVLRRAAKFVNSLFAEPTEIFVADISNADGNTPYVMMGNDKILTHPAGSHENGKDVDVSYIVDSRNNQGGTQYDWEKNFWFLYSVLESSSVDLVITAYKPRFLQYAAYLHQQGLISQTAAGRFNVLMEDHNLNHDKHVHITISNANNGGVSRKFSPTDDVYTCYMALRPSLRGGNYNYCL